MINLFLQSHRSFGLCLWTRFSCYLCKLFRREKENNEQNVARNELPLDIWGWIFERLPLADRIRVRVVSKEWSASINQTLQPVWMQFGGYFNKKGDLLMNFFDFSEGTMGKLKISKSVMLGAYVSGVSKGWLAVVKGTANNLQTFLFDPISETEVPLPPLPAIISSNFADAIFDKIQISSNDAFHSVVAAIIEEGKTLALCRPKDKKWTIFQGLADNPMCSFASILFCDGILHALIDESADDDETPFQFQTRSMRLDDDDDDDVILKLIPSETFVDIGPPIILEHLLKHVDLFAENWMAIPYMVECDGDLLVVLKILDALTTEDGDDESGDAPPLCSYLRVSSFEVFKVDANDSLRITKLSSLGEKTLLIDGLDSRAITSASFNKNCIYFLEDSFGYIEENWEANIISRESGVFNLDSEKIERIFPSLDLEKETPKAWFCPNIKIGI